MQNSSTTKKIIIGLVVFLVLFFAGGAVWYFFIRGKTTPPPLNNSGASNPFPQGENKNPIGSGGNGPNGRGEAQNLPEEFNGTRGESFQLVRDAVSGAVFANNKIRYVDRASGNVFETDLDGKSKNNLSNNKISNVFDAVMSPAGNRAIIKYFSGDRTIYVSALLTSSSTQTTILPSGIKDVTFSPKGDKIAYVQISGDDALVVTSTPENKTQSIRLRTKYSSWRLSWPEDNTIYLLTSPSAYLDGFLYKITLSTGAFSKVLGPVPGLIAQANGQNLVYSATNLDENIIDTSLASLTGGAGAFVVKTIPEKCVWSRRVHEIIFCAAPIPLARGVYPDDWYKGKVLFSDIIVKINIKSQAISSYILPESADATKLFLSDDESTLFYINKADESLWKLKLP